MESDDTIRINTGRLLQSLGPVIAKARSLRCFNLDLQTESNPRLPDLSDLDGFVNCECTMSDRYLGARPCSDLKILNSILNLTGSQCREVKMGSNVKYSAC